MLELSNKTDLAMFQSTLTVYHYRAWHSTFNIPVRKEWDVYFKINNYGFHWQPPVLLLQLNNNNNNNNNATTIIIIIISVFVCVVMARCSCGVIMLAC